MKILYIAKTELAKEKLKEWEKDNEEYSIYREDPFTISEEYKDSAVDFILRQTAKRLKVPISLIKDNPNFRDSMSIKLQIKACETLGIKQENIQVKLE
jgi:hypothetical protein